MSQPTERKLSSDDHVAMLLSCIDHSTSGKVDFKAVAEECGIISPAAAQKRLSRLQKSHGKGKGTGNGTATNENENDQGETSTSAPVSPKTPRKRKAAPKKGTGEGAADGENEDESTETPKKKGRTPRGKAKGKAATGAETAEAVVKREEEDNDADIGVHVKEEAVDEDGVTAGLDGADEAMGDASAGGEEDDEYC